MGAVNTTYTFTATDTITSSKMNNIIDETTMTGDAILGTTLEVADGKLKVRAQGVTSNELAADSVTSTQIADGAVASGKLSAGGPTWNTGYTYLNQALDLGANITTSTNTFIDFHSVFPVSGYEARILRGSGANGDFSIINTGTGSIKFNNVPLGKQSGVAPIYGIRAWVVFDLTRNVSGGSDLLNTDRYIYPNGSGNVTKVTKVATGDFYIHFTIPMNNANYAYFGSGKDADSTGDVIIARAGTGQKDIDVIRLKSVNVGSTAVNYPEVCVSIIG